MTENPRGITRLVTLNSVPTKILIYDSNLSNYGHEDIFFKHKQLILMISGNPGEIEYYRQFMSTIHRKTQLPVVGVSNSGHNRLPSSISKPDVNDNPNLYNLDAQVMHKASFIDKHVDSETRLIVIGHSIASYQILELLGHYPKINQMIEHAVLIFPTIDSLIDTEYGKQMKRLFTTFYYPLFATTTFLNWILPQTLQKWLVRYFLSVENKKSNPEPIPEHVISAATHMFDPYCVKAIVCLALAEFKQIQSPNIELIKNNKNKLTLLYGEADHWCPVQYYQRIKSQCGPDADIRLCLGSIDHAFVMEPSGTDKIANLTVEVIENVAK